MMNEAQVIKSLTALAHQVRRRIFRVLVVAGAEGLPPLVLAEQWGVASTALSFTSKSW